MTLNCSYLQRIARQLHRSGAWIIIRAWTTELNTSFVIMFGKSNESSNAPVKSWTCLVEDSQDLIGGCPDSVAIGNVKIDASAPPWGRFAFKVSPYESRQKGLVPMVSVHVFALWQHILGEHDQLCVAIRTHGLVIVVEAGAFRDRNVIFNAPSILPGLRRLRLDTSPLGWFR